MDSQFKLKSCYCVTLNRFSLNCTLRCSINDKKEKILDIIGKCFNFRN